MIIVGELINATRKNVKAAIVEGDSEAIKLLAKKQFEAGSHFIDVNAGTFVGEEGKHLKFLVETVQKAVDCACCLDSPDPEVLELALTVHKGIPMINSISLEKKRLEKLLPILSNTDFKVVALCTSDDCVPETTEQRLKIADKLINRLVQNNISLDNIFVDPLVQPISTNSVFGIEFLKTIQAIMNRYPGVHTMCGLSNISFGLPLRKKLNQSFLTAAITMGMDGAIINPLDQQMMANIACAEALVGKDMYCENYLKAFRSGILEK